MEILDNILNLERTPELIDRIKDALKQNLSYKYEISNFDNKSFSSKGIEERLGQVKTPTWVAELISNLCIKKPGSRILDPCFGDGVFLLSAFNQLKNFKSTNEPDLWGVEIDPIRFAEGLQNISKFLNHNNSVNSFFCGNIFDFNEKSFDCI